MVRTTDGMLLVPRVGPAPLLVGFIDRNPPLSEEPSPNGQAQQPRETRPDPVPKPKGKLKPKTQTQKQSGLSIIVHIFALSVPYTEHRASMCAATGESIFEKLSKSGYNRPAMDSLPGEKGPARGITSSSASASNAARPQSGGAEPIAAKQAVSSKLLSRLSQPKVVKPFDLLIEG
eukprot:SAG31_NODE_641_length_13313_cov_5.365219_10_plen_176_part_00